jgi:hypothetical protein
MADSQDTKDSGKDTEPSNGKDGTQGVESQAPAGSGRYVYGVLDLLFAGLYLFVFLGLVPSRSGLYTAIAVLVSGLLAAGGVGMLLWKPWG